MYDGTPCHHHTVAWPLCASVRLTRVKLTAVDSPDFSWCSIVGSPRHKISPTGRLFCRQKSARRGLHGKRSLGGRAFLPCTFHPLPRMIVPRY